MGERGGQLPRDAGPGAIDEATGQRRRARSRIESPVDPSGPLPQAGGRRLSDAERQALRDRALSRGNRTAEPDRPVAPPAAGPVERPPAARSSPQSATTKPPPTMPRTEGDSIVRSRGMVALGTLLIVGLTVLAFAGGRLFGSPPEPPQPDGDGSRVAILAASPRATPLLVAEVPELTVPAEPPPTIAGDRPPVVCLDPGHGGPDRGFMRSPLGELPNMEEASLVLQHAWDLEARLQQRGFEVVMTRNDDRAVNADGADVNGDGRTAADDVPGNNRFATLDDIQARIDVCNAARADLLVSIHVNGFTTQKPRGYETWFTRERPFGNRSAAFATLAYAHLKEQFRNIGYVLPPEEERGVNPDTAANVVMENSLFKNFIITGPAVPGAVDPSDMPGAIVEALFVSNDGDAYVLASPEGRNAIVTAYENAIVEYFDWFPQGT